MSASKVVGEKAPDVYQDPDAGFTGGQDLLLGPPVHQVAAGRRHFYLRVKPKAAQERLDQILDNPEAALADPVQQQKEAATVTHTFEQAADLFLDTYKSKDGVGTKVPQQESPKSL